MIKVFNKAGKIVFGGFELPSGESTFANHKWEELRKVPLAGKGSLMDALQEEGRIVVEKDDESDGRSREGRRRRRSRKQEAPVAETPEEASEE